MPRRFAICSNLLEELGFQSRKKNFYRFFLLFFMISRKSDAVCHLWYHHTHRIYTN